MCISADNVSNIDQRIKLSKINIQFKNKFSKNCIRNDKRI